MTLVACTLGVVLIAVPAAAAQQASASTLDREGTLKLATNALETGNRAEAARLLALAADRFQSVEALLQLARLQAGDGNRAAALQSLHRAQELAPNSEEVLSAVAQASLAAGAPSPAVLTLQSLTRLHPTVAQYRYLLGVGFMQVGDLEAAADALSAAERIDPNHLHTLVALGLVLNGRKRYADAKPYLIRGVELDPENVDAVAALAEAEEGMGDLAAAESHARRVLAKKAEHATANLVMGLLLMKKARHMEARDAFEKAAAADLASPKAEYQLSLAYARLGDEASSEKHLDLYRQRLREMEERVKALRSQTGPAVDGIRQ